MKLSDFIKNLQKIEEQGHGEAEVFSRHGASGTIDELGHAFLRTAENVDDQGPFDFVGEFWVEVFTGN